MTNVTKTTGSTVLILGARGRFGLAAARAFSAAGWRVLGQTRPGAAIPQDAPSGMRWLGIALDDTQALAQALTHEGRGADVVVYALNPSAYTFKAWRSEVQPMAAAAIAITRALKASLMVPGNVYNFGAGMPALLREDTPQQARTVKGQIRIQMEQQLAASGVPCVVIRAGDFFGSGTNTWFDMFLVKNIRKGQLTYPGQRGIATAWAYLPDLARSFVAVAEAVVNRRAQLPLFEVLHFAGSSLTGDQWLAALQPLAERQGWVVPGRALEFSRLPWPLIRLAAPLVPTWASLLEMRYLWDTPHALDNDRLAALIGPEPHTPLELAVQQSMADLGLLPVSQAPSSLAMV